jgi:hypothetical protein
LIQHLWVLRAIMHTDRVPKYFHAKVYLLITIILLDR